MAEDPNTNLTKLLTELQRKVEGEEMSLGDMVEAAESRGFGPVLLVPALIIALPTGAIPGVPTVCALLTLVIAVQLAFGRTVPWLPRRLRQVSIKRERFDVAVEKASPVTRRIDRYTYPRLTLLAHPPAPRLIAAWTMVVAAIIPPLELVPFAAAIPGFALVFLSLGLSMRDGVLILLGLALSIGGFVVTARILMGG